MNLHTLNRSPADSRVYQQTLQAMGHDDQLLLIEDGVQGALPQLVGYFEDVEGRVYALKEDLEARGLLGLCADNVHVVDVDGFIELTEQADKTITWY